MKSDKTTDDRQHWITILEAAASGPKRPSDMDEEWEWLMRELGLHPDYFFAVLEALEQGRWRQAKNPRAYLKTVAKREAVKRDLLPDRPNPRDLLVFPDSIIGQEEVLAILINDYHEAYPDDHDWEWKGEFDSFNDFLISELPEDLKLIESPRRRRASLEESDSEQLPEPRVSPDWKKWTARAGFDKWEQMVVECRLAGKSRESALAEQSDDTSRRGLQAAFKRFSRTGMQRLFKVLEKKSAE